ncbi:MAG: tetratricopeptide repeat protein [Deltaproteobacteria bacterium]|nr:tetratricopeptide repeat protein [Deltaproteobacteria bacterium]
MNPCTQLEAFVDQTLSRQAHDAFQTHLADCATCRLTIETYAALERELGLMAAGGMADLPAANDRTKNKLISRVKRRRGHATPMPVFRIAAVATGIAMLLISLYVVLAPEDRAKPPGKTSAPPIFAMVHKKMMDAKPLNLTGAPGEVIEAPADGRIEVRIGKEKLVLIEQSRIRIIDARLDTVRVLLEQGTIGCAVSKRSDLNQFIVEVGQVSVRVVGTRFLVTRSEDIIRVAVDEGRVEVDIPDRQVARVSGGTALEIAPDGDAHAIALGNRATEMFAMLRDQERKEDDDGYTEPALEEHKTQSPQKDDASIRSDVDKRSKRSRVATGAVRSANNVATWRKWIIEGHCEKAERAINIYLEKVPRDRAAWSLLADCKRKAGNWSEAVAAYRRVVDFAPAAEANMARFRAGVLMQERQNKHKEAVRMFEAYLKVSAADNPLRADAMVRLGTSYLALGRTKNARDLLEQVITHYPGTPVSARAKRLLD